MVKCLTKQNKTVSVLRCDGNLYNFTSCLWSQSWLALRDAMTVTSDKTFQPHSILAHQVLDGLQVHVKVVESRNWLRKTVKQFQTRRLVMDWYKYLCFTVFQGTEFLLRNGSLCLAPQFMNDITLWLNFTEPPQIFCALLGQDHLHVTYWLDSLYPT